MQGHLSMRDMALQTLRYYTTVDQSSRSRHDARVRAPNHQSVTATRELSTVYPQNEEVMPQTAHIMRETQQHYYRGQREREFREPLPKQETRCEPLLMSKRRGRSVDRAIGKPTYGLEEVEVTC